MKQHLAPGQNVLVIGHDKKPHKAKIIEVLHPRAARVESIDGKHSAIADYSESGEINTFHFAEESKGQSAKSKEELTS